MNLSNIAELNIRVVGSWNQRIFTPNWITKYLFDEANKLKLKDVHGILQVESSALGYGFGGFNFLPKSEDITLQIPIDEEKIVIGTQIITKILKLLPHTPITGVGFNIAYNFSSKHKNRFALLMKNVKKTDIDKFLTLRYHHVKVEKEYKIYVMSEFIKGDKYKISFNFHHDKPSDFDNEIFLKYILESKAVLK